MFLMHMSITKEAFIQVQLSRVSGHKVINPIGGFLATMNLIGYPMAGHTGCTSPWGY